MANLNTPQPPTGIVLNNDWMGIQANPYIAGTGAQPIAKNLGDVGGSFQVALGGPVVPNEISVPTSRSLIAADNGQKLAVSAGQTLTVPTGLPAGFSCVVIPILPIGGSISIAASGTTLNGAGTTLARNYTCIISLTAGNAFTVS